MFVGATDLCFMYDKLISLSIATFKYISFSQENKKNVQKC